MDVGWFSGFCEKSNGGVKRDPQSMANVGGRQQEGSEKDGVKRRFNRDDAPNASSSHP